MSQTVAHIGDAEFASTIEKGITLVDFWAPWCGPCKMMEPVIEQLDKEYEGKVNVGKCNVDENPNLSINYGVTSIPCVLFIKGGQVVDKQVGAAPKNVFDKKIQKILGA